MVVQAKRITIVAAAGSLTDVLLANAEAMVVALGTSNLIEARRDDDINRYQTTISTV